MQYKILMSYKPIDYKAYKELEELGLLIPYDPKSPESNVYIYQSLENTVSLPKMKSIFEGIHIASFGEGSSNIPMIVSEYEVNKHLDKVKIVNLPMMGDNVRYSEYKKLVFSVINIDNNLATIKHSLRNIDLLLDVPLENLSLVENDEILVNYNSNIFHELDRAMYIDCDYIEEDISKQFSLIIRLKTLYKGYELIFVNPSSNLQTLLDVLKIASVFGNLNIIVSNMSYTDLLYSHDIKFLEYLPTLLVKEEGGYYSFINEININNLGFDSIDSFKLFNIIKSLHKQGIIDQDINFKSLNTKLRQSYDFTKNLYRSYKEDIDKALNIELDTSGELVPKIPMGEIDTNNLLDVLNDLKLNYYIDNIEYYIHIIKS